MSNRPCKAAIDCNGELMEMITNVPLLAVTGHLSDEALDDFNEMKQKMARRYLRWKEKHVDFGDAAAGTALGKPG